MPSPAALWSHAFADARGYTLRVTARDDGLVMIELAGAPALLLPPLARMFADQLHYAAGVAARRPGH